MKLNCKYYFCKVFQKLMPEIVILDPGINGQKILNGIYSYDYYIFGPMEWWFKNVEDVVKVLNDLEQLELGAMEVVVVSWNDAYLKITLDGAQSSNLSDDSVTDQPEGRFTYQEVKTIFLKYKEFLEMPVSLDSTLEFEL